MKPLSMAMLFLATTWGAGWWLTADQRGQRAMNAREYAQAAEAFADPLRRGVAWYRAGEFEKAEQAFAQTGAAEALYNRGNCLMLLGKYQGAIEVYELALERRPGWEDVEINLGIARARAQLNNKQGGDMGDQKIGADEVVFDKENNSQGQETDTEQVKADDEAMQALWLKRVQTKPADFLKAKFLYQLSVEPLTEKNPAEEPPLGK